MDPVANTLVRRLVDKGVEISIIPALIRDMVNSIRHNNQEQNLKELSRQIQFLGWYDFELDECTLQLIVANMGTQALAEISDGMASRRYAAI